MIRATNQPVVIRWHVRIFFVIKAYQRGLCVSLSWFFCPVHWDTTIMVTFFLSRNGVHTYIFRKRLSPVSLFHFLPSLPSFIISNAFFCACLCTREDTWNFLELVVTLRVCVGFGVFLIFWCRVWSKGSSERVGNVIDGGFTYAVNNLYCSGLEFLLFSSDEVRVITCE